MESVPKEVCSIEANLVEEIKFLVEESADAILNFRHP